MSQVAGGPHEAGPEGRAEDTEPTPTGTDALAEALSAEHSAVYGYEFIGGAADDEGRRDRAISLVQEHKALRDELHTALVERGAEPPPALSSYPLPSDLGDKSIDAFAVDLEGTSARAYLWLAASREPELRLTGARRLQEAAVRALEWGGEPDALPGFEAG